MRTLRPASPDDLETIVALRNAAAVESHGEPITTGHWLKREPEPMSSIV
jgi:hypothetical protein